MEVSAMKRSLLIVSLLILFLTAVGPGAAFAADEFLFRFERELQTRGYPDAERALIMTAAREQTWDGVQPEFAELAAYSLAVCARVRTEAQAREQMELVHHLGAMEREMKALGFTDREVARVAFGTARGVSEQLRARSGSDNTVGRGDLIRDRIRSELCAAGLEDQEAKIMERIRARVRLGSSNTGKGPH
jgi:hypothetical protein